MITVKTTWYRDEEIRFLYDRFNEIDLTIGEYCTDVCTNCKLKHVCSDIRSTLVHLRELMRERGIE